MTEAVFCFKINLENGKQRVFEKSAGAASKNRLRGAVRHLRRRRGAANKDDGRDGFNVSSRKRDTKRSVALVNQRNPRYRRANMGLNPNLEKNLPLIKAVEERLREEKEHLERNFGRNGQTEEKDG